MLGMKRWRVRTFDRAAAEELMRCYQLPRTVAEVLAARGISAGDAGALLEERPLPDPFEMVDMDAAVSRIRRALAMEERIAVYGDYDADGVTASVMLCGYLESLGADVLLTIPEREGDGYGLSRSMIDLMHRAGVNLVITVDNGISALEEARYLAELGMGLVVTDHHQPHDTLPEADAVVDPHRAGCPSRFKDFAGVGVALQLIRALEGDTEAQEDLVLDCYADLAALGTIGDVVPLIGENRTIARRGLARIAETDREGLRALGEVSGFFSRPLTAESVAFILVPRLNAAGRIASARDAAELLMCDEPERARELAEQVCALNQKRQAMEKGILESIEAQLAAHPDKLRERVLILAGEGWHPGVIGIVASRMVERCGKPCILLAIEGETARGSGRSLGDFPLHKLLSYAAPVLQKYGGHAMAAGLTLARDQIDTFTRLALDYAAQACDIMPDGTLEIDREMTAGDLTVEAVRRMGVLEPYGAGNPAPLFAIRDAMLAAVREIGGGKHLRLTLHTAEGAPLTAVWFGMTAARLPFRPGARVDVAFAAELNEWEGKQTVSIQVKDMRPSGLDEAMFFTSRRIYEKIQRGEALRESQRAEALPTREDFAAVYRYLRDQREVPAEGERLFIELLPKGIRYCRLMLALDVLREFGLIYTPEGRSGMIAVTPRPPRVDLTQSTILRRLSQDGEEG